MTHYIVLTGGPGSGKSTVLDALRRLGYRCAEETGRKIIRQELERSGHALPWRDKRAFRDRMLDEELRAYESHRRHAGPVFFDRGIIDTYGYSLLEGIKPTEALLSGCSSLRWQGVFIFPPWREIFTNDAERKQDFAEAQRTFEAMQRAYREFGYAPTEVPPAPVAERVRFILHGLGG
jgi:predicted ATPase